MDKIYIVIRNSFDDSEISFFLDPEKAKAKFDNDKESFDSMVDTGGALGEMSGEGSICSGIDFSGTGKVDIIESYDEYTIDEDDDNEGDE